MNRTLKFLLLCGGIFVCGVVVGGFGARKIWEQANPPQSFGPRTLERMTNELSLTAEQREIVEPVIMRAADELRRLRRESWKQGGEVIEAMDEGVLGVLTPEQRVRFAQLREEQRARMQAAMEERQRRRAESEAARRENGDRPAPAAPPPPAEDSR